MNILAVCIPLALLAASPLLPASGPPSPPQPDFTTLKSSFVPGEKTLFYDDFTDMTPDSPPLHFKVRGPAVELRASGDLRQLTVTQRGSIIPNIASLPKNFTFEAELSTEATNRAIFTLILRTGRGEEGFMLSTTASPTASWIVASLRKPYEELGRKKVAVDWKQPVKLALWVQDGRVRTFINGEKQLDSNQVEIPPITGVDFAHDFYGANQSIGYRWVRFAESAPDFSQMIASSGRYATHGILFDTDSDCLKPESAAVIQMVAQGLQSNPALKLLIEGHTDSVGDAGHNLDLSRRRADAVKAVLAGQFKIDPIRLSTAGLGVTKPVDTNDTPTGRAQNRRVEFVRQ